MGEWLNYLFLKLGVKLDPGSWWQSVVFMNPPKGGGHPFPPGYASPFLHPPHEHFLLLDKFLCTVVQSKKRGSFSHVPGVSKIPDCKKVPDDFYLARNTNRCTFGLIYLRISKTLSVFKVVGVPDSPLLCRGGGPDPAPLLQASYTSWGGGQCNLGQKRT